MAQPLKMNAEKSAVETSFRFTLIFARFAMRGEISNTKGQTSYGFDHGMVFRFLHGHEEKAGMHRYPCSASG